MKNNLWDAFYEAYLECPQATELEDDQSEEWWGGYKKIKKSITKTINYWLSEDSIGGSVLWNCGYYKALPKDFLDTINEFNKEKEQWTNNWWKNK